MLKKRVCYGETVVAYLYKEGILVTSTLLTENIIQMV